MFELTNRAAAAVAPVTDSVVNEAVDGHELGRHASSGGAPQARARTNAVAGVWERRADGTPVRVVADPATGRTWRVWAAGCAHVPGAPAGDCLVFDAGEVIRRVWGVPPGWPALAADALLALAERRPGERGLADQSDAEQRPGPPGA